MSKLRVPPQPARTPRPLLAFLGEAPGADEIGRTGNYLTLAQQVWPDAGWTGTRWRDRALAERLPRLPLVGSSGSIFNAVLRAADIDRLDCWVGNVFDEKAPENDVTEWMHDPAIYGAALERLAEELAEAQPTVVVAMGGTALHALTEDNRIARMRGYPLQATRVLPGVKVVPTYHPAYVMRVWESLPFVIGDVTKARREAEYGPELRVPRKRWLIEPEMEDLEAWTEKLLGAEEISIDIETGWGQITCIAFAPNIDESICVPFVDLRRPNRCYWAREAERKAWRWVKMICESPGPKKVGQFFAGYDAYWLLAVMGIRTMNLTDDPRLMHHALFPDAPKDLGFLGAAYTNMPAWKHWNKTDKKDD